MERVVCLALLWAVLLGCSNRCAADGCIRLPDGQVLVGVYFFTHWWEPWKSSDEKILEDLKRLKEMGYNTIFLDHEWSQMIAGDWELLDRGHRLAKQAGMQILPWLSAKVWLDIGTHDYRRKLITEMYGVELEMGVDRLGRVNRTKPYDPAVIEAGVRYCEQYIERYLKDGALLHVMVDGRPRPVVAPTVELEWEGSCDQTTQQMFRLWLRAKYGDVDALNRSWKTSYSGFEEIDLRDSVTFDLEGHCEGLSGHPNAVEDHVEFRSQVSDNCLSEISRRLREKYPDIVIATELPYQFGARHPHAVGYRVKNGANPSSAYHADILMIRATGPLTAEEEKLLLDHKERTGQKIIMTYRTYQSWGRRLLSGEASQEEMNRDYALQSARIAEGFGFYSWNEMVDTHVVPDPDPPANPQRIVTQEESQAAIEAIGEMARCFIAAAGVKE